MTRRKARTKQPRQPLAEGDSAALPKPQQRTVLALVAQREQVMAETNQALTEISDALMELADLYAAKAGLSEDTLYDFEQRGRAIVLIKQVAKDEKTEGQESPPEPAEGDEGSGDKNGD